MSAYPIEVFTETLDHKGGTKSYHFLVLQASTGQALVVFRFGKTGAFGQFMVEQHPNITSASKAHQKKRKEKISGGYQPKVADSKMLHSAEELRKFLGVAYLPQFGPENLKFLDPDFDVKGVKSPKVDGWDENGNKIDSAKRADLSSYEEQQRLEREAAEKAEYERMAAHPNFGLF